MREGLRLAFRESAKVQKFRNGELSAYEEVEVTRPRWFYADTGEEITDPTEIAKYEAAFNQKED
jgi:hypothetical protein